MLFELRCYSSHFFPFLTFYRDIREAFARSAFALRAFASGIRPQDIRPSGIRSAVMRITICQAIALMGLCLIHCK